MLIHERKIQNQDLEEQENLLDVYRYAIESNNKEHGKRNS